LKDRATVVASDVMVAIDSLGRQGKAFDIIFMDPPYGKLIEKEVLGRLSKSRLVDDNTMIIVESDLTTDYDYLEDMGFELYKTKKYKTNKHTFIYRRLDNE
jgi:16S rRNA G966 N2-methylase RsmD